MDLDQFMAEKKGQRAPAPVASAPLSLDQFMAEKAGPAGTSPLDQFMAEKQAAEPTDLPFPLDAARMGMKHGARIAEMARNVKGEVGSLEAWDDIQTTMGNIKKGKFLSRMTPSAGEAVKKEYEEDPARSFMLAPPGKGGQPAGPSREIVATGEDVLLEKPGQYTPEQEAEFKRLDEQAALRRQAEAEEGPGRRWRPSGPTTPDRPEELSLTRRGGPRMREMTAKEAYEHSRKMGEQGRSVFEWIDKYLGVPGRVVGAVVEDVRESAKGPGGLTPAIALASELFPEESKRIHRALGIKPMTRQQAAVAGTWHQPKMPFGERFWKSVSYERPVYLTGLILEAGRDLAGRDLTGLETVLLTIGGLVGEFGMSPWMFPGKGGVPAGQIVPKQLQRAAGRTMKLAERLKAKGRPIELDPAVIEKLLARESHVDRVAGLMEYGKQMAQKAGINPDVFEDSLRAIWGPSAKRMGRAGMTIGHERLGGKLELIPAGTIARKAPAKSEWMRYGAEQIGGDKAAAVNRQIKQIDKQTKALEKQAKAGKVPMGQLERQLSDFAKQKEGLEGILERMGTWKGPVGTVAEDLHYFQGAPPDVKNLARQAYAKQQMMLEDAARTGATMRELTGKRGLWGKLFRTEDKSKTAGRVLDVQDAERGLADMTDYWKGGPKERLQSQLDDLDRALDAGEIGKADYALAQKSLARAIRQQPEMTLNEVSRELAKMDDLVKKIDPVGEEALFEARTHEIKGLRKTQAQIEKELVGLQAGFDKNVRANMMPYLDEAKKRLVQSMADTDAAEFFRNVFREKQAGLTDGQRGAMNLYRNKMDDLWQEFTEAGGNVGYRNELFSRIETAESSRKHMKVYGAQRGAGGPGIGASRSELQAGVAAEGSHGRQFYTSLDEAYQQYALKQAMAISNMKAENSLLETVGRRLDPKKGEVVLNKATGKWHINHELLDRAADEGLVAYVANMGKHSTGPESLRHFLVPKSAAVVLERMTSVEKMHYVYRAITKFTSAWKTFATVWRPGFVSRNVLYGNLYNMMLADVDLTRSIGEAARLQAYRAARQSDGLLAGVALRKTFGESVGEGLRVTAQKTKGKVKQAVSGFITRKAGGFGAKMKGTDKLWGKHTADDLLAMAEKYGVFSGDFTSADLRMMAKNRISWINPASRDFFWARMWGKANKVAEENARLATFLDKVRKGYSPAEAADVVARTLFNYNELTRALVHARRTAIPFLTWPLKNWGLQLTKMVTNPRKQAMTLRAMDVVEEMDPATPRQLDRERTMPRSMRMSGYFRDPRIISMLAGFGEHPDTAREYRALGNLSPLHSLNLLAVHDPDQFFRNFADMLFPIWKVAMEQGGAAPSIGTYGFHGVPFAPSEYSTRKASPWFNDFAEWVHDNHPAADKVLRDLGVRPEPGINYQLYLQEAHERGMEGKEAQKWAEKNAPRIATRVPAVINYLFESLHPGINRILGLLGKDEAYDRLGNFIHGSKTFELTDKRAVGYHKDYQMDQEDELRAIENREKSAGYLLQSVLRILRGLEPLVE